MQVTCSALKFRSTSRVHVTSFMSFKSKSYELVSLWCGIIDAVMWHLGPVFGIWTILSFSFLECWLMQTPSEVTLHEMPTSDRSYTARCYSLFLSHVYTCMLVVTVIQKPRSLPQFCVIMKGHSSSRAPSEIKRDLCGKFIKMHLPPLPNSAPLTSLLVLFLGALPTKPPASKSPSQRLFLRSLNLNYINTIFWKLGLIQFLETFQDICIWYA